MNSYNSPVAALPRRRRTLKGPARLVAVLVAVALVVSTSACGGDEPVEYFTPSPSTPTPEVVASDEPEVFERPDVRLIHPPKKPNVMLDLSEESALAFAHYFVEVLNYTANSGDTSILEEISGPECDYCQFFVDTTNGTQARSNWVREYKLDYRVEPKQTINTGLVFAYDVDLIQAAYSVFSAEGEIEAYTEEHLVGALIVYRLGEYWLVRSFGTKSEES